MKKKLTTYDKIMLSLNIFFQIILVGTIIYSFFHHSWLNAFSTIIILFITFLPALIQKNFRIVLPFEFTLTVTIFIFMSLYLGSIHSYYTLFWWWDILLHLISGIILGFIGFIIVYILNKEKSFKLKISPELIAIFSFTFALAIGTLWEIFEFMLDSIPIRTLMQDSLSDTMWDLIVDSLGAFIVTVSGYYYVKKNKILPFNKWLDHFIKKNSK